MKTNRNIPYYMIAAGLFVLLKVGFIVADNDDLMFLLKPTNKLVGILTGSQSVYLADAGFFYENMHIVIEKSCSGFNFWILCFLFYVYLGLKYFDKHLHKTLTIPTALLCAYLLAILANMSRIVASIVVRNQTIGVLPYKQAILHEAVGITTYFSFFVLGYYLIEQFLKHTKYAKLA